MEILLGNGWKWGVKSMGLEYENDEKKKVIKSYTTRICTHTHTYVVSETMGRKKGGVERKKKEESDLQEVHNLFGTMHVCIS